jgi:hypothetical protein
MTLTLADIERAQKLYRELELLTHLRHQVQGMTAGVTLTGYRDKKEEGSTYCSIDGFSAEAIKELRELASRDLRNRAAIIVEQLHKLGCEAVLTPKDHS